MCEIADAETFNYWLKSRTSKNFGEGIKVGMRNWSALQMMLKHFDMEHLQWMIERASPETIYVALQIDTHRDNQSDNTHSYVELLSSNEKITTHSADFYTIYNKLHGTYVMYELYHYFKVLKPLERVNVEDAVNLSERKEQVGKLIAFLDNPPESYRFSAKFQEFFHTLKKLKPFKIQCEHCRVRPFSAIMEELCTSKQSHSFNIMEGYKKCKVLYNQTFAQQESEGVYGSPEAAPPYNLLRAKRPHHEDEGERKEQRRSPSPKKVRFSSKADVLEIKKGK